MASVSFAKCKTKQEVKALFRHDEKTERSKQKHPANEQIDPTKTQLNYQVGMPKGMRRVSYATMCSRYDSRIAELDQVEGQNKRKDRVTLFSMEFPVPKDLPEAQYKDWFERAVQLMKEKYGKENFISADVHVDEIHEYVDPDTKQKVWSRVHCHALFVPELDGRLNAKACTSRANIMDVNERLQKMTEQEFGVQFMDGTQQHSRGSVEQMKQRSRKVELDEREAALNARERLLEAREADFKAEVEKLHQKAEKALREAESALRMAKEVVDGCEALTKAQHDITMQKLKARQSTIDRLRGLDDLPTGQAQKGADLSLYEG